MNGQWVSGNHRVLRVVPAGGFEKDPVVKASSRKLSSEGAADVPADRLSVLGHWDLSRAANLTESTAHHASAPGVGSPLSVADDPDVGRGGQRLLAMLALRGPSSRAEIRGTLWPASSESAAASRLRTVLWRLSTWRGTLLVEQRDLIRLSPSLSVDLHRMQRAAAGLDAGLPVPEPRLFELDLLPSWPDPWLVVDRERIRQTRLHALEALAARYTKEGRYAAALEMALAVVSADPLRESGHRAVIRVHVAEHNIAEAIRQYRECCALLADELHVDPSPALTALVAPYLHLLRPLKKVEMHAGAGRHAATGA